MTAGPPLDAIASLAAFHREHEKHYAEAPLHDAIELQRMSRTLKALAERWATETGGALAMEGHEPPPELGELRARLLDLADEHARSGAWLATAMENSWDSAEGLLREPALADLLGERHRIIANDWLAAAMSSLVGRHLTRAVATLDRVGLCPAGLRGDLAGPRHASRYLFAASELLDRAADLAVESATLVHDNERRWRVLRARVHELVRQPPRPNPEEEPCSGPSSSATTAPSTPAVP